jgi:hypothetical protein
VNGVSSTMPVTTSNVSSVGASVRRSLIEAGRLGDRAQQTEHRGSDQPDACVVVSGPTELQLVDAIRRHVRVEDAKRQRLAGVLEMWQEVQLRLLGHPIRTPHSCNQLGGSVDERRCVGDTRATLVVIPAAARHRVSFAESPWTGPVFRNDPRTEA